MNDYKELISTLRTHAEYCDMPFSWMNDSYEEAADAIEHLVKERDEWKTLGSLANKRAEDYREMRRQRDKAIKERDAAVEDLKDHGRNCKTCLHGGRGKNDCLDREEVPCKWEWRGVMDIEHE